MHCNHPMIPVKSFRFYFATQGTSRLPQFPGSAWRGAFGHALKKTVCVVRDTPCAQCMLKNACAYSYIFETPLPEQAEKMRKYTAAPHPFVLHLSTEPTHKNGLYPLDITLFGHGQRYLPYIIHAMHTAGLKGIGGQQQIFTLEKIDDLSLSIAQTIYQNQRLEPVLPAVPVAIPAMPRQIEIHFHTPLRIKHDQKNLAGRQFNFGVFFSTLLRRISMISYFHTDTPLETDFAALTAQARTVNFTRQQLSWHDWTRYSSRQQTEMNMGGLIGTVTLEMQGMEVFWPYLWLGQWTHVGKGTSMGLGAYSIKLTSLPNLTNP